MLSPNLEASGAKMQPLSRRSSSRLSLSELGGSVDRPNFSLADIDTLGKVSHCFGRSVRNANVQNPTNPDTEQSPVTSRLLVLASPTPASKELNDDPTPPRRRSSVHRWGTSGVAISPQLQRRTSEPLSPLPNQPTRLYTEHEVYAELRKSEQEVPISLQDTLDHLKQDSSSSSSDNNTALPISEHGSGGVMELSGDILLPFADRREVKDVLLNSVHKSICDLLRSDSNTWSKVLKLLDIPRDVMNDQAWITELKAIIYPKGESLWHRVGTAIGIDPEDAAVTPQEDYNTVMWIEPLVHGDSYVC